MRLIDLEPRWLSLSVFAFKCPHCQQALLTCKNVVMSLRDQHRLYEQRLGEGWNLLVVGCKEEMAWNFKSNEPFETMTVTPSLDASASGHWHGFITAGAIVTA